MNKTKVTRSLLAACSIVALTAVMYGCVHSGNGDDDPAPVVTPDPVDPMEPTEPMEPTDLDDAQAAAKAAADAAKMASDNAATAASGAGDATMNLATMQTGAMAMSEAAMAQEQADAAMTAYMAAKMASDTAAAAAETAAAIRAQIAAEAAQADAETAAMNAKKYGDMAMASAMGELMIDGTMKSVGETTIDALAGASTVTTGSGTDAQMVMTGLIKDMNPMADGDLITGNARTDAVADDLGTDDDETAKAVPYKQSAAARTFAIGKTLDSSDDMARLMLVTDHVGLNMVKVFNEGTSAAVTGTKPGLISVDPTDGTASTDAAHANKTALRSVGMFYPAGAAAGDLTPVLQIGALAKPVEVFSYTHTTAADPPVTTTEYVTLTTTSTTAGETSYTYTPGADIMAPVLQDGPDDEDDSDDAQVISGIPGPVAYKHLHFGVWAALGDAAKDGAQKITGLGIGFVQSIGDGMTGADMPNVGDATYNGSWVATVQSAAGDYSLGDGDAELKADFDKDQITADLTGLAKLEGSIAGSMFSGTKATVASSNSHGLTGGGKFTGSFDGGFYGAEAAESAGIFDFSSTNGGAFTGAFGGAKQAE